MIGSPSGLLSEYPSSSFRIAFKNADLPEPTKG